MTPDFAEAVDPIFLFVFKLLDRIERNERLDAAHEREVLRGKFQDADSKLERREQEWKLTKYAIVSWIDDLLIYDAPWDGKNWWENNSLEFEMFNTRDRATEFYNRAKEAAKSTRSNALEVYYVCAALGFRGFYRESSEQQIALFANHMDLPTNFESWAKQASGSIRRDAGRPPMDKTRRAPGENMPLDGKFKLLGTVVIGAILAAIMGGLVMVYVGVS
jgi:type VI secretion system protein ImpK